MSVKVAIPVAESTVAVVVPTKVPPELIVAVITGAEPVIVLFPESTNAIWGCVVNATPEVVPAEAFLKINFEATPGVTVMLWVAGVIPDAEYRHEYVLPAIPEIPKSAGKVAIPVVASTVAVVVPIKASAPVPL